MMRVVLSKVVGVTFEGRQDVLEMMQGTEVIRLRPEPDNKYDPNAIAVDVAFPPEAGSDVLQVGYLPRDVAEWVAPLLEGENLICEVAEITGGFMIDFDRQASYGLVLRFEVPQ